MKPYEGGQFLLEQEARIKQDYPNLDIAFDIERNLFCVGKLVPPDAAPGVNVDVHKVLDQFVNVGRANASLRISVIDAFEGATEQNT